MAARVRGVMPRTLSLGFTREVDHVHDGVDAEHEHAIDERDGLDDGEVVVAHGVHHQVAEAGIGEDHLHQHGAAEHESRPARR